MAAQLAKEQLALLTRHPERFQWQIPAQSDTNPFPIVQTGTEAKTANPIQAPAAMPLNEAAFQRESAVYEQFHWTAQGRFPDVNAAYCEVTVVMQWVEAGRPQMLALTSALPRFQAPAGGSK